MELEREGVLVTARSRGTFVSNGARRLDPQLRRARLADIARRAIVEARAAGFTEPDLVKAIASAVSYTHLDVYKRQVLVRSLESARPARNR